MEWSAPAQEFGLYSRIVHMPLNFRGFPALKATVLHSVSNEVYKAAG